jgi:hypothetical protein
MKGGGIEPGTPAFDSVVEVVALDDPIAVDPSLVNAVRGEVCGSRLKIALLLPSDLALRPKGNRAQASAAKTSLVPACRSHDRGRPAHGRAAARL